MNGSSVKQSAVVAPGVPLDWQIAGLGDLNGDGKVDVVWRHAQTGDVAGWLMSGSTVAQSAVISPGVPATSQIVRVDDVNGDGQADLVWRQMQTGHIGVWFMEGFGILHAADVHDIDGRQPLTLGWQVQR